MYRRLSACAVLFAVAALQVVQRADHASAQNKDKKDDAQEKRLREDLAKAEKQVAALKQEIAQGEKLVAALRAQKNQLEADLAKALKGDAADAKTIKGLQATIDGYRKAGLVHVVILKLKPDSPPNEVQSLIDDTHAQLAKIKTVRAVWAGKPAGKAAPEAKDDYTAALVFLFEDREGLKQYLDDPVHTKFADRHLKKWETPVVYDFEPRK